MTINPSVTITVKKLIFQTNRQDLTVKYYFYTKTVENHENVKVQPKSIVLYYIQC